MSCLGDKTVVLATCFSKIAVPGVFLRKVTNPHLVRAGGVHHLTVAGLMLGDVSLAACDDSLFCHSVSLRGGGGDSVWGSHGFLWSLDGIQYVLPDIWLQNRRYSTVLVDFLPVLGFLWVFLGRYMYGLKISFIYIWVYRWCLCVIGCAGRS